MGISIQRAVSVSFTEVGYGVGGPRLWKGGHELGFECEKYDKLLVEYLGGT